MLNNARRRANKKGLPCELELDDIAARIEAGLCEATGVPFGESHSLAPSLDRKDSSIGYTADNTQVVLWFFNRAKSGDLSDSEAVALMRQIADTELKD